MITEYKINHAYTYWANPDNRHHNWYQAAVNRLFVLFIVGLSLAIFVASNPLLIILGTMAGVIIGGVAVVAALFILDQTLEAIGTLFRWAFGGY